MPEPTASTTTPIPGKDSSTDQGVTVSLGKGKNVVLGGGAATGLGGLAWVIMQLFSMHNEAMSKIAAVESRASIIDAKVTALQTSLDEAKATSTEQRAEMRSDIRELNGALNALTRGLRVSVAPSGGGTGSGYPLFVERDFDGDLTRDSLKATAVKRGAGGQATP